jgi:hypothetical protein
MKTFLFTLCLLAILTTAHADLTIVQEVTSTNPMMGNKTQEMTIMVSKGRTRIEHAQGGMIMAPAEKKNIILMHAQKMYMNMPQANAAGMNSQDGSASPSTSEETKWEKTGKKEKIAGYDAEQWIGKNAAGKMVAEVWIGASPEIITEYIDSLSKSGQVGMAKLIEKMRAGQSDGPYKNGFPLKSVMYDEAGVAQATTVVKRLDSAAVDAKWFEIPAGYKEMPGMGQGGMPAMPQGAPSE